MNSTSHVSNGSGVKLSEMRLSLLFSLLALLFFPDRVEIVILDLVFKMLGD